MIESVFTILVRATAIFAACGLLVAVVFLARWRKAFDPVAAEGSWGFRVLVVPGIVALWPVILMKVRAVHRGESAAGDAERPVAAERLRRNHSLAFTTLAVVGTLLFVIALTWRAPRLEDAPAVDVPANLNTR